MNGFIHTAKKGECLSKIASQYGLTWQQLWHHNDNQKLNHKRKDPDVILEGDEVFIPESKPLIITMRTGESKVVQVNLPKNRITLSISNGERPRSRLKYFLKTNLDEEFKGVLGDNGEINLEVNSKTQYAELILYNKDYGEEIYDLDFGHLDPIGEYSGIQQRLRALQINVDESGIWDEQTKNAIRSFQALVDLPLTGEFDEQTKNRLLFIHGR